MRYSIKRVERLPELDSGRESEEWSGANVITIERFLTPGHDHKPRTEARMLHDGENIAVFFYVDDRYVIAKGIEYQARTHRDSCVEFFWSLRLGRGISISNLTAAERCYCRILRTRGVRERGLSVIQWYRKR